MNICRKPPIMLEPYHFLNISEILQELYEFNLWLLICCHGSRVSEVGIATSYGLGDQGVGARVPVGAKIFYPLCRPDLFCGPPSLLSNGYQGLVPPGVKPQEREADYSPPTTIAEDKKTWIYTPTSPIFTFTF
jgi:hypothetical protein